MKEAMDRFVQVLEGVADGRYDGEVLDYTRPDQPEAVRRIAEAMGMMMVKVEAREYRLEGVLDDLRQAHERLRDNVLHTVQAMARALGVRDGYTLGHADRVSRYASRLARRYGMDEEGVRAVALAGTLHDIGKIGFSDKVFNNEDTRPTPEMMEEIKAHPGIAVDILGGLDFLGPALEYIADHHERLDGGGYPRGLSGGEIPRGARVLSVADCFDAMTTTRTYQEAMPEETAFGILRKLAGPSLDPELVETFIAEIKENGMEAAEGGDAAGPAGP